ncbi:MAG: ribokinase [Anaerolineae bacterium]|nr:ribokinase [Anaerolineae bacterium]
MTKPRITVIGSYNTDLTIFTPRMPQPGETVLGKNFKTGPGGKGSNQAVAAARLGADVTFVGRIGRDMFGEMARDLWAEEGIDASHVITDPTHATGVASILVDEGGENIIVVASGANWAVSAADAEQAEAAIAESKVLLMQLETPLEAVQRALEIARAHDVLTILNPAPGQVLTPALLSLVDILTPNQSETAIISGSRQPDDIGMAQAVQKLGVNAVVMTQGSAGVLLSDPAGAQRYPAFSPPGEAIDTTGAGDAFNGALAVALAEGHVLADAIRFATAAAAISVTRPGATDSMPTRDEVDALLRGA